jgi:hypothetical protein
MANSAINLASLDFDTLKQNLKFYLQNQSAFKDYNYEGSNINVLLDVLTYNSFLNSFYLNMIASEMFLDTAQKYDSVVSHAKELNYLPRSNRSSKAVISFTADTQGINNPFIIPKGAIFSGLNSNGSYVFTTNEERSFISTNTTYNIVDLEIYEGAYNTDTFLVDYAYENQSFVLSTATVDTTDITVTVSENNGQTNTVFTKAENLFDVDANSTVYFLQATSGSRYELIFGDNVFGRKPQNGAVITAEYRVSEGSDSNGISAFNIQEDLGLDNGGIATTSEITVSANSSYGANAEGIESIRYNAPRHYQTQGRCITTTDYQTTILQNFPEIQYVSVFGGTISNSAVEYGKVYISPSTYGGVVLTNNRKQEIETFINNLCTVGISARVIDPDFLFIKLNSKIHVDFKSTPSSATLLISKATAAVKNYNQNSLLNFNTAFRMSKLEQKINESDVGILSNETSSQLFKSFSPPLNKPYAITCDLGNALDKGSVTSSEFIIDGKSYLFADYLEGIDAGTGKVYIIEQNPNLTSVTYTEVGTVNYLTGVININQLSYFDIGGGLQIIATPLNQDIYCKNNTIISIDTISGLNFTVVNE